MMIYGPCEEEEEEDMDGGCERVVVSVEQAD